MPDVNALDESQEQLEQIKMEMWTDFVVHAQMPVDPQIIPYARNLLRESVEAYTTDVLADDSRACYRRAAIGSRAKAMGRNDDTIRLDDFKDALREMLTSRADVESDEQGGPGCALLEAEDVV